MLPYSFEANSKKCYHHSMDSFDLPLLMPQHLFSVILFPRRSLEAFPGTHPQNLTPEPQNAEFKISLYQWLHPMPAFWWWGYKLLSLANRCLTCRGCGTKFWTFISSSSSRNPHSRARITTCNICHTTTSIGLALFWRILTNKKIGHEL